VSGPGDGSGRRDRAGADRDRADREGSGRRGLERLGDLLPDAARQLGLEDQLELAAAMAAWQRIVAERIPAAAGACRIVALSQGVATVEADEPIVAQEVRLRTSELVAALRSVTRAPVRQLRVTLRHV
jgi:predicted nucleic acid-binding Zn ribbon protein